MLANGTIVPGLNKQQAESKLPPEVVSKVEGQMPNQVIKTYDPKLTENNLPEYPALPVNYDEKKVEETRRTILVLNDKPDWRLDDLMDFFKKAGEVKYACFAENDRNRIAMIEFVEQKSVIYALRMQGSYYLGSALNIYHSTQPIVKPEAKSNETAQKEIEEAMLIVEKCHNQISAVIDPAFGIVGPKAKSVSRRHSRSRSRSHSRRSKSRKSSRRSRSRKRSTSRSRRKRSASRKKSRSRSRSRSKRRKRSVSRRKKSRSRSKEKKHRRRDRSRSKHKRSSHRSK
jgi:splicing factor, arginine/serine-rich 12